MKDKPIRTLDDLKGAKVRGPTKSSTAALQALGAVPVGMPVPKVPESLSTGVIAGALLPYEVTLPLKVHELVKYHSETGGARGLYTSVFLFGMNKKKYEGLPADLKKVIDANSGRDLARQTGKGWDEAEEPGRAPARARGNQFNTIGADEMARWKAAVQPVTDTWLTDMQKRGLDGRKMLDDANALLAKYSK
jgi:TRAP-type C4-dicarboxylate transport system substrate-binding protein